MSPINPFYCICAECFKYHIVSSKSGPGLASRLFAIEPYKIKLPIRKQNMCFPNFQHSHHHHHHRVRWLQVPERSKWGSPVLPFLHSCISWNFSLVSGGGKKKVSLQRESSSPTNVMRLIPIRGEKPPDWPLRCNLFSRLKKWNHVLICFITLQPFEY